MYWNIAEKLDVTYRVEERTGLFEVDNSGLADSVREKAVSGSCRALVFIDEEVYRIYKDLIRGYFQHHSIEVKLISLEPSEENKDLRSLLKVVDAMNDFKISRRSEPLIAIGGGVIMDIVGFAASVYRRGAPYYRIPTTLMGLVDAGIGVKTGINYDAGKNRLGSYFAPSVAFLDKTFLRTVENRHLSNGISEIIKMALIKDKHLFSLLEKHAYELLPEKLQNHDEILRLAVGGMLEELAPNLWEKNLERIVDYGHTFSPVVEMFALPELLHGEAVAIDMALSLALAYGRELISHDDFSRSIKLLKVFNLPISNPVCTESLIWEGLEDATKHRDGLQRVPLTNGIGDAVFVNDISKAEIKVALELISTMTKSSPKQLEEPVVADLDELPQLV